MTTVFSIFFGIKLVSVPAEPIFLHSKMFPYRIAQKELVTQSAGGIEVSTSEIFTIGNREQWWLLNRAELFEILKNPEDGSSRFIRNVDDFTNRLGGISRKSCICNNTAARTSNVAVSLTYQQVAGEVLLATTREMHVVGELGFNSKYIVHRV